MHTREVTLGSRTLSIETGKLAKQADGSVIVDQPHTQLHAHHSCSPSSGSSRENTVLPGWLVNSMMPP